MSLVPPRLIEQVAQRECVLFLGPDMATAVHGYLGLPSSWQLADALAAACDYRGRYMPLPRIALIYQRRFSAKELVDFVREQLTAGEPRPLPPHTLIAHLPLRLIVHTGWDTLLEEALQNNGRSYRVIYSDSQDVTIPAHSDELLLYKPFGTLDDPSSLIITEDQQQELFQRSLLLESIRTHLRRTPLFVVAYAPDYDTILAPLYRPIRTQTLIPPAYVVQSMQRAQDADYLAAWDMRPIIADPTRFLYDLATVVAPAALPAWETLSVATTVTQADVVEQVAIINRTLDTLGISPLVEQSDLPLLNVNQVRELEQMRDAYERLTADTADLPVAATMWLRQGNIEYARQNYEQAESYYRRVLTLDAQAAEAYHNLHHVYLSQATLLHNANRHEEAQQKLVEALTMYQQAITLRPDLAFLPPQYEIEAILGQGGMGVVYRVWDKERNCRFAVKVLRQAHMYNEQAKTRFQREATLLQRLQHSHIVQVIHWDMYNGRLYIVMDDLGQSTLDSKLRETGSFSLDEANRIVQQIGSALQSAHNQGIIHRDVKPSNIFLLDGTAKLIDFGLAVELDLTQASMIGLASGSIRYMAPEQRMGLTLDKRTDVYALATLFYEMVTGYHPDEGTYRPIRDIRSDTTPSLDLIIDKARTLLLENRYNDIDQFCANLQEAMNTQPGFSTAPTWRRSLARYQSWLHRVSFDYWWLVLLGGIGLGVLSSLAPLPLRILLRATSMAAWGTALLNILLTLYMTLRARQTGYVTLATFGGTISTVLVLVFVIMLSQMIARAKPQPSDFMFDLLYISFAVFFLGIVSIGLIFAITRWAYRREWGEKWILSALSLGLGLFLLAIFSIFYFGFELRASG